MGPGKILKGILLPLTDLSILMVMALFTILVSIGIYGGPLGILIILLSLPPIFRYQLIIVEACARDESPGALDADYFNWVGGAYTFFPLPVAFLFVFIGYYANDAFGISGIIATVILACITFPATLALLAITHSPLQSINPVAIFRLYTKSDHLFWIAPIYFAILAWLGVQLESLPMPLTNFLQIFFMFSLAALSGTLIAPNRLVDEVDIPDALEPDEATLAGNLEATRSGTLAHAYGFITRNNREGGFKHIMTEIERDPDPAGAWLWYFDKMQRWEENQHALFFAQHMIRDMLQHGETVPALKLVMRCRLQNEQFRPFREEIPALLEAAESGGNTELAAVLKAM